MFLPALLFTNLGSQLHLDNILTYIPILVWAVIYQLLSLSVARTVENIFHVPRWVVGAVAFNNAAAFPSLLIQAGPADSSSDAMDRARSYFLVSAFVSNTITFGVGPSQLNGYEEDAREQPQLVRWWNERQSRVHDDSEHQDQDDTQEDDEPDSRRHRTSLLPDHTDRHVYRVLDNVASAIRPVFHSLPAPARRLLRSIYAFLTPPFAGGVLGVIIGLVPPLHRIFFAETDQGAYFSAWLTESLEHLGQLFVSLQVVIVGVKLSTSLRKEKRHEDTGYLPWGPLLFTAFFRFILWPA
ncbi:hypothetical protein LTR99_008931 [Exophiala xenobiotica]|nr:hypothetical protein LTR99_008931 [Exophiala xenobiotica]